MICWHKPGSQAVKKAQHDQHRVHVASGGNGVVRVLTGSALTEADGETDVGNFGIFEAAGEAEVRAFVEADPFTIAGIVDSVEIVRLPDRFKAHRIQPLSS
ncbi:YciI family protein [Chelativorans salis]|uniref:YciI family protein n=1 Tax=Chelativorans salis TaxID=2978478 RepID=A0ABT2LQ12_9HYPH|nr:YciI family protein [Chelativorans sp. EGI FJ00035]MCT7376646.1 YciI family protein [Chelativorans sp. EGI FJ00035]